jgi:tetratricopeptide (TPR) repeat protein
VSLRKTGEILQKTNHPDEAEANLREALKITQRLTSCHPDQSEWFRYRLINVFALVDLLGDRQDTLSKVKLYRSEMESVDDHLRHYSGSADLKHTFSNAYLRLGDDEMSLGDFTSAAGAYERAIQLSSELYLVDGNDVELAALSYSYAKISQAFTADKQPSLAVDANERQLVLLRAGEPATKDDIARVLGDIAWYALLANNINRSLSASEAALAIDRKGELGLKLNRAHALMVAGRLGEARSIYYENIGSKDKNGSWEILVLQDFKVLQSFGINSDLMDEVMQRFSSNGSDKSAGP